MIATAQVLSYSLLAPFLFVYKSNQVILPSHLFKIQPKLSLPSAFLMVVRTTYNYLPMTNHVDVPFFDLLVTEVTNVNLHCSLLSSDCLKNSRF